MRKIFFLLLLCLPFWGVGQVVDSLVIKTVDSLIQVSRSLTNQHSYDQAMEINTVAEHLAMEKCGLESAAYGAACFNHGRILDYQDKYPEAEKWYLDAKVVIERELGKESPDYIRCLNNLAGLYISIRDYVKAEQFYLELNAARSKALGKEHPDYIKGLNNLGVVYIRTEDYPKAEQCFLEAKNIREKILGKKHSDYASSVHNLASVYHKMRDYKKAEPLYLEAKAIRETVLGKEHPDYAGSLNNMAIFYRETGNYETAALYYAEAGDILTKKLGNMHPDYADHLNNFGVLQQTIGNYKEAEILLTEAKSIREKVLGKTDPQYVSSINNLANLYQDMGLYEAAETLYLEAKKIREITNGKENMDYEGGLQGLANLYLQMGNYKASERLHLEAKSILEKISGRSSTDYIFSVNNLSVLYVRMGDFAKALPYALEAKDLREKSLGKSHPDYAVSLRNLGEIYWKTGNYKEAEMNFLEAKSIREKALGTEHPNYASIVELLGTLYFEQGNYEKSRSCFTEATRIRENVLGKMHPDYISGRGKMADVQWALNDHNAAAANMLETSEMEKKALNQASRFLSERELSSYTAKFQDGLDRDFSYTQLQNGSSALCYDDILFYKGFLLNTVAHVNEFALSDAASAQKFDLFKSCHRKLAAEYAKPLAEQKNVPELEEKANSIEKDLARNLAGFGEALRQVDWKEVQQNLHPNEAAIEFVRYHLIHPQPTDSIMYAALVLKSGASQPVFIPLFEEKKLDKLLQNRGKAKAEFINDLYTATPTQSLYQLIWQPLEQQLTGIKTIYFSPAGLLYRLNPGAIIAPPLLRGNEERETIASRYHLVELGSTRQLAFPSTTAPNGSSAVLYGGIQYDLDSIAITHAISDLNANSLLNPRGLSFSNTDSTLRGGTWDYLKWTDIEVTATAALLNDAGLQPAVRRGSVATEESFKTIGIGHPSPRILHIATHGFFFPDPENKGQRAISNQQEPVFKSSDHPMIRSGLILAGGNYAWQKGKPYRSDREDGILTAYEISQMNLRNTELVVLSACETGLGDIQGNEGVYGLQRAFKIAGVKYLIMSLWQVPDFQTQELMAAFYNKWLMEKMTIPEAFSAAQNAMREKYKDPLLWAGFILVE